VGEEEKTEVGCEYDSVARKRRVQELELMDMSLEGQTLSRNS